MLHFIRLRGPWNYRPVSRWIAGVNGDWRLVADDLPDEGVISLPGNWCDALDGFEGSVQFTRAFRCPEAVAAAAEVWLGIGDVNWLAKVELNEQVLGEVVCSQAAVKGTDQRCPTRFSVKKIIQPRNLLTITVTSAMPTATERRGGQLGLVRLEIESTED